MNERCVGGRSDLGDNNEWFARIEDFDFSYSKARYLDKKESVRRNLAKMAVRHSSDSDSCDEVGGPALNTPVGVWVDDESDGPALDTPVGVRVDDDDSDDDYDRDYDDDYNYDRDYDDDCDDTIDDDYNYNGDGDDAYAKDNERETLYPIVRADLDDGRNVLLDIDAPIALHPSEGAQPIFADCPVLANIILVNNTDRYGVDDPSSVRLQLVDARGSRDLAGDLYLVGNQPTSYDDSGRPQNYGYVRIDRGNYVTVGRGYLSDRFQYSDCVSSRHAMISYCFAGDPDGVIIEDLRSTNGTSVECADGPTREVRIR
ncbi:FHA domain-containing protein [Candidatus Saccharibacteria bacterium]|nr:FHA domain-containing protein [Candidatus Saccharibacteria bacterium]